MSMDNSVGIVKLVDQNGPLRGGYGRGAESARALTSAPRGQF
jgi:hypothetical protein